ncbi:MAG: hypothetical protein ACOCW4_02100 [bacterium]
MKTVFNREPKPIIIGTIILITGAVGLLFFMMVVTNFILGSIFLLIELLGVGIIIRHRIKHKESKMLKPALLSSGLCVVILLVYLLFLMP